MRSDDETPSADCSLIGTLLGRMSERWSLLLIAELADEPRRFHELRNGLDGVSQRMLTRTLRALERDGLVSRTVLPTSRAGVEYAITPLGRTFIEPVRYIATWVRDHAADLREANRRFDAAAADGDRS